MYGVPEIIPWWESERVVDGSLAAEEEFDTLLSGALSHMSMASQKNFKRRVDKLIARAEVSVGSVGWWVKYIYMPVFKIIALQCDLLGMCVCESYVYVNQHKSC